VLLPKGHLLGEIRESQESTYDFCPPAHKWHESASEIHRPLGVARLCRPAASTPLGVGKLGGVDVASNYFVLIGERECSGACGSDAKHAPFPLERRSFNLGVFVHAPKE
jgi:hypothetical protein